MMADTRELLLTRLLAIATAVKTADTTIKSAIRNRGPLETDLRPAIILLDGDETSALPPRAPGRGGQPMPPAILTMSPELFVLLEEQRPQRVAIGERVNAYRIALIEAVAGDAALLSLLGSNGRIVYRGCATDLKSGSSLSGEMRLDFALTYVVNPASNAP
jgi:hypothetical protein